MKKFNTPVVEKIEFDYKEVVVASSTSCQSYQLFTKVTTSINPNCTDEPISNVDFAKETTFVG